MGDDIVGAVGVSGTPGKDDDCAQAGIDKVADQLNTKPRLRTVAVTSAFEGQAANTLPSLGLEVYML